MSETVSKTAKEALMGKDSTSKGSPLMSRAYQHRCQALHVIVEKALTTMGSGTQLLLLGAGLDTSYERLYADHFDAAFTVDVASITEQRDSSSKIKVVKADLRDIRSLKEALVTSRFDFSKRTVILVEMVLNYLPSTAVEDLLLFLSGEFSNAGGSPILICYDYFKLSENSAFSSVILQKFRMRGAPLEHAPLDKVAQHSLLRSCGWSTTCVNSVGETIATFKDRHLIMNSIFYSESARDIGESAPFFDEYASLALLDKHYAITIASITPLKEDKEDAATAVSSTFAELGLSPCQAPPPSPSGERSVFVSDGYLEELSLPGISIKRMHKATLSLHWNEAAEIYCSSMRPYAEKYGSVAKFVNKARKQMQQPHRHFATQHEEEYSFWIAQEEKKSRGDKDNAQGSIIGLVGLRGLPYLSSSATPETDGKQVLELCHMAVEEKHRGKGVGTALLKAVMLYFDRLSSSSSDRGLSGCRVDLTVLTDLRAAHRLYWRAGFANIDEPAVLPNHHGPACLLQRMTLSLPVDCK